jgi:hypothetical protein
MSAKGTAQPGFFRLKEQSQRKKSVNDSLESFAVTAQPQIRKCLSSVV